MKRVIIFVIKSMKKTPQITNGNLILAVLLVESNTMGIFTYGYIGLILGKNKKIRGDPNEKI